MAVGWGGGGGGGGGGGLGWATCTAFKIATEISLSNSSRILEIFCCLNEISSILVYVKSVLWMKLQYHT